MRLRQHLRAVGKIGSDKRIEDFCRCFRIAIAVTCGNHGCSTGRPDAEVSLHRVGAHLATLCGETAKPFGIAAHGAAPGLTGLVERRIQARQGEPVEHAGRDHRTAQEFQLGPDKIVMTGAADRGYDQARARFKLVRSRQGGGKAERKYRHENQ